MVPPFTGRLLTETDGVEVGYSAEFNKFIDPAPVVPRCRKYPFTLPVAADQPNVTVGPASVPLVPGNVSSACADAVKT